MNGLDFCHNPKNMIFGLFWGLFFDLLTRQEFFSKNQAPSLLLVYHYLTSCKKSEKKTDGPFLVFCVANGWTNGRTSRAKFIKQFCQRICLRRNTSLDLMTVFHLQSGGRFRKLKHNFRRKKQHNLLFKHQRKFEDVIKARDQQQKQSLHVQSNL